MASNNEYVHCAVCTHCGMLQFCMYAQCDSFVYAFLVLVFKFAQAYRRAPLWVMLDRLRVPFAYV